MKGAFLDAVKTKLQSARPVASLLKLLGDIANNAWKKLIDDKVKFDKNQRQF